jgi:fructose-1,6-bisphosphatase/inositol monophosphatase family enzyme
MMSEYKLGNINGHAVGRILKETVRRATVAIRNERLVFEAHVKEGYNGTMDDVFTSADTKAQEIYLRTFRECFPGCGVIGEEDSLVIQGQAGLALYCTVDPLDGTKAYVRRQSHGVGTMVALVYEGEVISAYIGDINTEEVYGYRPGSKNVHRITRLDTFETLGVEESSDLKGKYALLRSPSDRYSLAVQKLLPQFKDYEVLGSSIGIWMAQLWKREVCAVFKTPGWETPWDSTPIIGISQKLGYAFLRPTGRSGWTEFNPVIPVEKCRRDHETLIIHRNDLKHLRLD